MLVLLSALGLCIADRYVVHHALSEVAAHRSTAQGGSDDDRDALIAAAQSVLAGEPVVLLSLARPDRVVVELRARYGGRTKAPEGARRFLLHVASEIERAALRKAA